MEHAARGVGTDETRRHGAVDAPRDFSRSCPRHSPDRVAGAATNTRAARPAVHRPVDLPASFRFRTVRTHQQPDAQDRQPGEDDAAAGEQLELDLGADGREQHGLQIVPDAIERPFHWFVVRGLILFSDTVAADVQLGRSPPLPACPGHERRHDARQRTGPGVPKVPAAGHGQ